MIFEEPPIDLMIFVYILVTIGSAFPTLWVGNKIVDRVRAKKGLKNVNRSGIPLIFALLTSIIFCSVGYFVQINFMTENSVNQIKTQTEKVYGVELTDVQAKELGGVNGDSNGPVYTVEAEDYIFGETTLTVDDEKIVVQLVKDNGNFKLVDKTNSTSVELERETK